jgi:type IV secretory pathway VirB2 component (pilin)
MAPANLNAQTVRHKQMRQRASLALLIVVIVLLPVAAHAQSTDPNTIAQNIETFMTGAWGKSIASVAFGCVGLVAWWGYMSWATAAKAVLGGVCLFSAPWFVTTFFGQ